MLYNYSSLCLLAQSAESTPAAHWHTSLVTWSGVKTFRQNISKHFAVSRSVLSMTTFWHKYCWLANIIVGFYKYVKFFLPLNNVKLALNLNILWYFPENHRLDDSSRLMRPDHGSRAAEQTPNASLRRRFEAMKTLPDWYSLGWRYRRAIQLHSFTLNSEYLLDSLVLTFNKKVFILR